MKDVSKKNSGNDNMPVTSFTGMFDKLFQESLSRLFDDKLWRLKDLNQEMNVPVNVRETDKSYELELVAPGLRKEDFKVSMSGDTLTVSFNHKEESNKENKEEGWLRREYRMQSFSRSFKIDNAVDASKIAARYSDGILHLSLPKKEDAQRISRTIEIK